MNFPEKPFVPTTLLQKARDVPDVDDVDDVEDAEDAERRTRLVLH